VPSDDAESPAAPSAPIRVKGQCAAGFEAVREAFHTNFAEDDEVGAALCVRLGDEVVVDLWGGYRDHACTQPWTEDTLVNAYSVGKGLLAGLLACVVEAGKLDWDERVGEIWPEFACEGKQDVRVRELASHQAGLPAIRERLPAEALFDWNRICQALATQAPYWKPGSAHGYHTNTFGFLLGEVIARRTGMPVAEAFRHYMSGPAEADFYYGVGEADLGRCAEMASHDFEMDTEERWAMAFPPTGDREHDHMIWHAYFNPSGASGLSQVNTPAWRQSVIPSTSGHGTARGVAKLYAGLLGLGVPLLHAPAPALIREATRGEVDGDDRVLGRPSRFGIGFQLPMPTRPLGPSPSAFGHYGYGGSLGFADPSAPLAFGYLINRPGDRWQTPRTQRLIDAVYTALAAL
jgi:CubicO group peptidase (beta-lactamase class C family)